jgi:hypothetical protein
MLQCWVLVLFVKPYFHGRQLEVPKVARAIPLVRDDLHGLCGGVLGRNDTLRGVPTRLQVLTGRPAGR